MEPPKKWDALAWRIGLTFWGHRQEGLEMFLLWTGERYLVKVYTLPCGWNTHKLHIHPFSKRSILSLFEAKSRDEMFFVGIFSLNLKTYPFAAPQLNSNVIFAKGMILGNWTYSGQELLVGSLQGVNF